MSSGGAAVSGRFQGGAAPRTEDPAGSGQRPAATAAKAQLADAAGLENQEREAGRQGDAGEQEAVRTQLHEILRCAATAAVRPEVVAQHRQHGQA